MLARHRREHGAVEILRLDQPGLRPLPVERAGEDAGRQLEAREEVGRELAVPPEGGDPRLPRTSRSTTSGNSTCDFMPEPRGEGPLGACLLREPLREAGEYSTARGAPAPCTRAGWWRPPARTPVGGCPAARSRVSSGARCRPPRAPARRSCRRRAPPRAPGATHRWPRPIGPRAAAGSAGPGPRGRSRSGAAPEARVRRGAGPPPAVRGSGVDMPPPEAGMLRTGGVRRGRPAAECHPDRTVCRPVGTDEPRQVNEPRYVPLNSTAGPTVRLRLHISDPGYAVCSCLTGRNRYLTRAHPPQQPRSARASRRQASRPDGLPASAGVKRRFMSRACKATLVAFLAIGAGTASAQQAKKPNIIVLFGDDIGYWNISAYNRGMMGYRTPNIDSIAKDGAIFTDAYGAAELHRGPRGLHHRPVADPHRHAEGRPPRRARGAPVGRPDHRQPAQGAGLCDRPVREEPPGRQERVHPDRPRLRRVLRQLLPPERRAGAGEPGLPEEPRSSRRCSARAACSTATRPTPPARCPTTAASASGASSAARTPARSTRSGWRRSTRKCSPRP